MVDFHGSSEHVLDDKGRIVLPQRILDRVARDDWKFVLTAGLDRCLLLHDHRGFEELKAKLARAVPGSPAHRALNRRFFGYAEVFEPDSNRRVRIPEALQKFAGLAPGQPVVLLGTGRVCELWAPQNLDAALAVASPDEEALFEQLMGSAAPSMPATP